jgi:hypothetical protein
MFFQEGEGFVGEGAEAHGVEFARGVVCRLHAEDAGEIEAEGAGEIGGEGGDGEGGGDAFGRAGGGGELEDGSIGRGGARRTEGGAFEEKRDARGQFVAGAGEQDAGGKLGILVGGAAAVEEADAAGRTGGEEGAGEKEIAGEGVAVAGESGADAQGVGQEGIADAGFGNDAFAHIGKENGGGGFPLDFEPANGFARGGGIGLGEDHFAGQGGLQEIEGILPVEPQAAGGFVGGLDEGGEGGGGFDEQRIGGGGGRGVAAVVEIGQKRRQGGFEASLEFFEGAEEEGMLGGEMQEVVEGGGQMPGLARVEIGEQVAGVVEAEADAEEILGIGMAEKGGDGGVGGLAQEGEPGREQAAGGGGGKRDAVGQEEREAVDLKAAGEGAGMVGIGGADGEGALFALGSGQQFGEGFGFVGGLVEDVDLILGNGEGFVFPAVGDGAAPSIDTHGDNGARGGLEPPRLAAHAPQTCVSAIPPPEHRERDDLVVIGREDTDSVRGPQVFSPQGRIILRRGRRRGRVRRASGCRWRPG